MPQYYEFEVSLQDIQPRIWRRFLIRTTATFWQLHQAIQHGFGWREHHLWEFRMPTPEGRPIAGLPDGEEYERPVPHARTVKLDTYFTGRHAVEWCEYQYDFGDDWTHDVKLISVRADKESFKRRLLDGERNGPPEDCGGTTGYERMVHFVKTGEDLQDLDPEGLARWLGGWLPDAFVLEKARAVFDR
ncbi:MAG: plasmid pRiA4b ORF-3 family protein [Candidatus Sericytochromatia bacterium]|nr:plasmid pRiA4b ORF-3 family protein [Candidatus Tanganyikabacteria bacterium]